MIRILESRQIGRLFARRAARLGEAEAVVRPILDDVRKRGDRALMEYARREKWPKQHVQFVKTFLADYGAGREGPAQDPRDQGQYESGNPEPYDIAGKPHPALAGDWSGLRWHDPPIVRLSPQLNADVSIRFIGGRAGECCGVGQPTFDTADLSLAAAPIPGSSA